MDHDSFLSFTLDTGLPMMVRAQAIDAILPTDKKDMTYMTVRGDHYFVMETFDQVSDMIKKHYQATHRRLMKPDRPTIY